jgi:hypothetical protein
MPRRLPLQKLLMNLPLAHHRIAFPQAKQQVFVRIVPGKIPLLCGKTIELVKHRVDLDQELSTDVEAFQGRLHAIAEFVNMPANRRDLCIERPAGPIQLSEQAVRFLKQLVQIGLAPAELLILGIEFLGLIADAPATVGHDRCTVPGLFGKSLDIAGDHRQTGSLHCAMRCADSGILGKQLHLLAKSLDLPGERRHIMYRLADGKHRLTGGKVSRLDFLEAQGHCLQ